MLGIWNGGDWLKRDLDQPMERGSPIIAWFIALINDKIHSIDFDV